MSDLIDAVLDDHRTVNRMLDDAATSGDARHRRDLVERAIVELMRHWGAEEQVLYPAVRRLLPDGDAVADRGLAAHADGERLMKRLRQTDATAPGFDDLVTMLVDGVRDHLRDAESVLPRLRETCPPDELAALGREFGQARRVAPTRPHPAAPATTLVRPGMALADRVLDVITGRKT